MSSLNKFWKNKLKLANILSCIESRKSDDENDIMTLLKDIQIAKSQNKLPKGSKLITINSGSSNFSDENINHINRISLIDQRLIEIDNNVNYCDNIMKILKVQPKSSLTSLIDDENVGCSIPLNIKK